MTKIMARLEGVPEEWYNVGRLAEWADGHADPDGDVWVIIGCDDKWHLYRPGSPRGSTIYAGVEPDATRPAPNERLASMSLDVHRVWALPWVAEVSGRQPVDCIDGWGWYNDLHHDYAIYVRVAP
jgi:hypothetical protein